MVVARHLRVAFSMAGPGTLLSIKEMAFFDASAVDVSVGGVASASSVNSTNVASRAFDKDTATVWQPTTSDAYHTLSYDHGVDVSVTQVKINFAAVGNMPAVASSMRWMSSADGSNWTLPAPLKWVSGDVANNNEVTFDLLQMSEVAVLPLDNALAVFAGSVLPSGMPVIYIPDGAGSYRDFEFGGFGRVAGTVKKDATPDIPVKRRVRLHREQDGLLIREVWSDPVTGAYSFDYIDATKQYTVITYDYEHDYRAVIADNITPEAMP